MLTFPRNPQVDFDNAKAGFGQRGLRRIDIESVAYMKVIAPLTSTGPSIRARVVRDSANMLTVRFPHIVFAGALVQVRIQSKVMFGKALHCIAKAEAEYEIEIEKQEIY